MDRPNIAVQRMTRVVLCWCPAEVGTRLLETATNEKVATGNTCKTITISKEPY